MVEDAPHRAQRLCLWSHQTISRTSFREPWEDFYNLHYTTGELESRIGGSILHYIMLYYTILFPTIRYHATGAWNPELGVLCLDPPWVVG